MSVAWARPDDRAVAWSDGDFSFMAVFFDDEDHFASNFVA